MPRAGAAATAVMAHDQAAAALAGVTRDSIYIYHHGKQMV
jgi:hypothetical protein